MIKLIKEKYYNRYWVTDSDYIPLSSQPENGYTKIQQFGEHKEKQKKR